MNSNSNYSFRKRVSSFHKSSKYLTNNKGIKNRLTKLNNIQNIEKKCSFNIEKC